MPRGQIVLGGCTQFRFRDSLSMYSLIIPCNLSHRPIMVPKYCYVDASFLEISQGAYSIIECRVTNLQLFCYKKNDNILNFFLDKSDQKIHQNVLNCIMF